MHPIEPRINDVVNQALLCARYRIAPLRGLRPTAFVHAMGLRYGLLGAAAVTYAVESIDPADRLYAYGWAVGFRSRVEEHILSHTFNHFPITVFRRHIPVVAEIAQEALTDALPMPMTPVDAARNVAVAVDRHLHRHVPTIRREWGVWRAGVGERLFLAHAIASENYANAFLARRRCGFGRGVGNCVAGRISEVTLRWLSASRYHSSTPLARSISPP